MCRRALFSLDCILRLAVQERRKVPGALGEWEQAMTDVRAAIASASPRTPPRNEIPDWEQRASGRLEDSCAEAYCQARFDGNARSPIDVDTSEHDGRQLFAGPAASTLMRRGNVSTIVPTMSCCHLSVS